MSHTVIQVDSKVSSSEEASRLKNKIKDYLVDQGFNLHDNAVNDGSDMNGAITLRVKTDHNVTTEANMFFDWLWNMAQNNKAQYDSNDTITGEGFTHFRLEVHDCKHLEGLDEPCKIGNHKGFDVRPE